MDNYQRQANFNMNSVNNKNSNKRDTSKGSPYMVANQYASHQQVKAVKPITKEVNSKSQSPHTQKKFLNQQATNNLFSNNSQSYLSNAPSNKLKLSTQQLTDQQRVGGGNTYNLYGQAAGTGVKGGLQQAPSMPHLMKDAHEAYSYSMKMKGQGQHVAQVQKQAIAQKTGGLSQMPDKKQKKIMGVFTNYGGAMSSNSNDGQGSGGNAASAHRSLSNKGSVNSNGSNKQHQNVYAQQLPQPQAHSKNSNKSQNSVKSQQQRINDNLYYPQVANVEFQNQNQRSAGHSNDSQKSNQSRVSVGVSSLQSGKAKQRVVKQTSSQRKSSHHKMESGHGQDTSQFVQPFNNDYGMADNIGMSKGPVNVHPHFSEKTKFAAYQAKIQVNNTKQNRKTPKFPASSNMSLTNHNQTSFSQKSNKQMQAKTRNHGSGQNRTAQPMVVDPMAMMQSPRSRGVQELQGSGGYRVKSNKNSEEPRTSAQTEQNKNMQLFQTEDPDSEKQHKLRMKKKLLMSDSLQMLTKQRNQYLHHSINKSIQSKNNSQKSNQSREQRVPGVSMQCVVGVDETQNEAIYGALNDQQIQTITMHNSIQSSNQNFNDTHQSSSITGSFNHHANQPAPMGFPSQVSQGSKREYSFRYKDHDGRIEHIYSGEYTEPEIIEGFGGDECISSRRQTKHSPSFPQSIVTSGVAGQTIVHSLNSQDNMSSTGTLVKNASGGAPMAAAITNQQPHSINSQQVIHQPVSQNMTQTLQQKAINVKKAMAKVSQGFKEKFSIPKANARANDGAKIRTPSSGKNMIDKKEFAQKLQKVQDDIRLRNQIQEQRELELDKLQQDFQEQITDAKSKTSAQQSIMESSSRELTFQLKELERLQQQTQFENDISQQSLSFKNNGNENLRLKLKLNSHRDENKNSQSGRFQNKQNMPPNLQNLNSDRYSHRQLENQAQQSIMNQNLVQSQQRLRMGLPTTHAQAQGTTFKSARGMAPNMMGNDSELMQFQQQSSGLNSATNSARNGGQRSQRSQKRGNKNINQKEMRQKRDVLGMGVPSSRMSSTPRATNNILSQIETSEQNYGHEISQTTQMTPTVGQFQPVVSNQKSSTQHEQVGPHNIKMRPLNLNQFQQSQPSQLGDKYRKQFNFHSQLSSSRLSAKNETNTGAKMSERDAETERKGKIPSSRSSLMASQNIQVNDRSKPDRILNVKVTKKAENKKNIHRDTSAKNHYAGHSMNQEGTVQIANFNLQAHQSSGNAAYGSGSKRGLNSRNLNYSDLKSPTRSNISNSKHNASSQKYDDQIYMTIGQADPHPSQQTQIEMSASHLEQSNTSHVNSSQASQPGMSQTFYSVDQRGQKKKFSTISHEQEGTYKNQINTMAQNSRVQKRIRINELPISPRHKGLSHVNKSNSNNSGLRILKNKSGQKIYMNTIQHHHLQQNSQKKASAVVAAGGSADGRSQHQVYQNNDGTPFQNLKVYRQQESRSLENNERMFENRSDIILSDKPQLQSDQQQQSSTGCDFTQSRSLKNQRPLKKMKQNTLEMQMTGKGQYKLVKVKNRSQDPYTRASETHQGQQEYNIIQPSSQLQANSHTTEADANGKLRTDNKAEYSSLQQTPQINNQYNSRRNPAPESSHKNFNVMVVRSSDGQKKQITGPISKMGAANAQPGNANAYDQANKHKAQNEYVHQQQKAGNRSHSSKNEYILTRTQPNGISLVAVDQSNTTDNNTSLSDNYANTANQGKRANSTQSEQLKRSKINASQLFDNSFLCCLTQTKQKKESIVRQFR